MRKKLAPVPEAEPPPYQCGACWFFETKDVDTGACYGLPPQPMPVDEAWGFGRPLVDPSDRGCIHHKPRHNA